MCQARISAFFVRTRSVLESKCVTEDDRKDRSGIVESMVESNDERQLRLLN